MTSPKSRAYGGVVVDDQQRVLLREPNNHFDGYVWTFAKGKREPHETPEDAACREVLEEMGYSVLIREKLSGEFASDLSVTEYFLMQPVAVVRKFDAAETSQVRWATFEEAEQLIRLTTNQSGRRRDLAVLAAVLNQIRMQHL